MYDVYTLTYYYNIYIIVGYNTTNGEIECHYMYTTTDYTQYFNALILQCKLMFKNEYIMQTCMPKLMYRG